MSNSVLGVSVKLKKNGEKKPAVANIDHGWWIVNGFFTGVFTLSVPLD